MFFEPIEANISCIFFVKFKGKVPNFDASWHVPSFQLTVLPMTQMKGMGPENMPFTFKPINFGPY